MSMLKGFAEADAFKAETKKIIGEALTDEAKLLAVRRSFVWALIQAGKYAETADCSIRTYLHNYVKDGAALYQKLVAGAKPEASVGIPPAFDDIINKRSAKEVGRAFKQLVRLQLKDLAMQAVVFRAQSLLQEMPKHKVFRYRSATGELLFNSNGDLRRIQRSQHGALAMCEVARCLAEILNTNGAEELAAPLLSAAVELESRNPARGGH